MIERYVWVSLDSLEAALIQYGDKLEQLGKYMTTKDARDAFYDIAAALEKAYGDATIRVHNKENEEPS